jgi:L-fucose mutarotase
MPLKGVPASITPELLYVLSKMGHGDAIVIADSNFPSDSVASDTVNKVPIRVAGTTSDILRDILKLIPLDPYSEAPVCVMDRVQSDKDRDLHVPAYRTLTEVIQEEAVANVAAYGTRTINLTYLERFQFYDAAKKTYCIVQTTDKTAYANVLVVKGVL